VRTPYGWYSPNPTTCIIFIVFFTITAGLHLYQGIKSKRTFMIVTAFVCAVHEAIGWGGRLTSYYHPTEIVGFQLSSVGTLGGTTPLMAGTLLILAKIMAHLGPQYARLTTAKFPVLLCPADVIGVILQAMGGLIYGFLKKDWAPIRGPYLMLTGSCIQTVVIVGYYVFAWDQWSRWTKDVPANRPEIPRPVERREVTLKIKRQLYGVAFCVFCLTIRQGYRQACIGAPGFVNSVIMLEENYFNWCDGFIMVLALFSLNLAHPWYLLDELEPQPESEADAEKMREKCELDKELGLGHSSADYDASDADLMREKHGASAKAL